MSKSQRLFDQYMKKKELEEKADARAAAAGVRTDLAKEKLLESDPNRKVFVYNEEQYFVEVLTPPFGGSRVVLHKIMEKGDEA